MELTGPQSQGGPPNAGLAGSNGIILRHFLQWIDAKCGIKVDTCVMVNAV